MEFLKTQWLGIVVVGVLLVHLMIADHSQVQPVDTAVLGSNEITTISNPHVFTNTVQLKAKTEAVTSDDTLLAKESGTTYYVSGATTTITLPAATAGVELKFVIGGALTGNFVIDSAEGDNIEGSLIVAGAVVDCDAEDQLNFVSDGENVGDFVQMNSDGTNWYIGESGALTSAKLTCTDPS